MDAQDGSPRPSDGWRDRVRRARADWRSLVRPRTAIGLLAALVVVAVVANSFPTALPQPTVEPTDHPGPSTSPHPTDPPAEAWGDLAIPAWEPIAELRPVDVDASGVAVGSAFTLRSRTSAPAADLATGLTAEPAVSFRIVPGASPAEVTVVPSEPLAKGVVYRFRLDDPTGALAGTWAYRTAQPLHVVGTTPGDETSGVPVNTGIEIQFDQDGVADLAGRFTIDPVVDGRFEAHGRTVVFVAAKPLAPETIYRVKISAGVTMSGSDQVLETPVEFAFETDSASASAESWDVALGRPILEASPDAAPIIGLDVLEPEGVTPLTSLPFEIYRLPSFAAAKAAAVTLAEEDGWSQWGANDLVATDGLTRVAAFDGTFDSTSPYGYKVVRFPGALAAGWYVVVVPRDGRDRQVLLQVTTLAAFALTSQTRTLAWINDTATGAPIAGATLADPEGEVLGTTASTGLLDVPTPSSLLDAADDVGFYAPPTIVTIAAPDGRRLLVALGLATRTGAYDYERNGMLYAQPNERWWLFMSTDRTVYRTSDTVHAWGVIRSRLDASVPGGLEITLRTSESSSDDGPWLARVPVITTPRGTWAADLPIRDLPLGGYIAELRAGGAVVTSTWISVDDIRKPAYEISVETDAPAYISGDPVTISARAVFFDGTPAVGLNLRIDAFGSTHKATADADGRIRLTLEARTTETYMDYASISVVPDSPEEGEIAGYTGTFVFPSAAWITADGVVRSGRLVISGSLNAVDLDLVAEQVAKQGWPEDPSGSPIAGRTVTLRVVEEVARRTQIGTTYDYIEKVTVPLYEYTYDQEPVGTYTTTSGTHGEITLSVPVDHADGTYSVTITARDGDGLTATTGVYVVPSDSARSDGPVRPYLGSATGCGTSSVEHAVGDSIDLTMHDGDGTVSTGGEYLFIVASQGVREARVQDTASISRTFAEADLPSVEILAVRFQDGAYVVTNEVYVRPSLEERTLGVTLTSDRSRYAPGERATVSIVTTGPDGRPVAADVVVRAVDEKLFAGGQAFDTTALATLLAPVGDGILRTYQSHPLPVSQGFDGCGDTTGGGRDDFRDSALFELVSTGSNGRASVAFDLPDDLTSWHVSATALGSDLRAGDASLLVPVGLPFFADAILASDYLVGERPVIRVRSFGDALEPGDRVRFTITAASLLLPATTVEADAFGTATLELPQLSIGVHDVTIAAAVVGDPSRKDTLTRKIVVRSSRLQVATSELTTPGAAPSLGGTGLTTYVVTDAGRGSLLPILQDLAYGRGARFDRQVAADVARELLTSTFGVDPASLPPTDFERERYQRGGVALLPYSSTDLALTAMTAIVAPDHLRTDDALSALRDWQLDESGTRERAIIALAGRAGLGDDVLAELHDVDIDAVTIREALWIALGLVASGDEDGARVIERALLEAHGQALGPWVRLDVGGTLPATLEAASLLGLVAAGIGDPLAPAIAKYVREIETNEAIFVLPELGMARWSLDRLPRAAATFAWTIDGARHEERLEPGASWSVTLTQAQRAGFHLETLTGSVAVLASWTHVPGVDELPSGNLVTIARTVTPGDNAAATGLVKIRLRVVFAATAPIGCWDVTDRTPSGLAPIANVPSWGDEDQPRSNNAPYEISGQRVSWCLDPADGRDVLLGYAARVVSSGSYTWEPAVVQSVTAPDVGASTPATTYTIR